MSQDKVITEGELLAVLGGVVMSLCSVMPPALAREWAQMLRTTARAASDGGHTMRGTLLQGLADAAVAAANTPRS